MSTQRSRQLNVNGGIIRNCNVNTHNWVELVGGGGRLVVAPWTPGGSPKAGSQEPGCPCGQSGCSQGGLSLGPPGQGDVWASHPTHCLCPWVTGELTAVSTKCRCSCSSRVCSWVRFLLPSVAGTLRARESVFCSCIIAKYTILALQEP